MVIIIGYDNKTIEEAERTKFLCIQIDSNLNWKTLIQYVIPILSSACLADSYSTHETETLALVHFAYFHSIMLYGIIFAGNSMDNKKIMLHTEKNN
jgi:NADH:ubiquinone oxidoreductase subunit H